MVISENDSKTYIEIYLNNQRMGINFDSFISLGEKAFNEKEEFLKKIHKDRSAFTQEEINKEIDNYTKDLLLIFFTLNSSNNMFSYVQKNFINEYVINESEIEGVNSSTETGKEVMAGLERMYRYIHSDEEKSNVGRILITDLHEQLFSYVEGSTEARAYRTDVRFFPGTGIELEYPLYIPRAMREVDRVFDELSDMSKKIYNSDADKRLEMLDPFLKKLMQYKAEVVRINPFPDGNKRSTRGMVNYLFEKAGLPPVYVKVCEHEKYSEAIIDAIKDYDYNRLINFYKNKLCDSIKELVLDPFKEEIKKYKESKLDGKNTDRVFKKELKLIKSEE